MRNPPRGRFIAVRKRREETASRIHCTRRDNKYDLSDSLSRPALFISIDFFESPAHSYYTQRRRRRRPRRLITRPHTCTHPRKATTYIDADVLERFTRVFATLPTTIPLRPPSPSCLLITHSESGDEKARRRRRRALDEEARQKKGNQRDAVYTHVIPPKSLDSTASSVQCGVLPLRPERTRGRERAQSARPPLIIGVSIN